MDEVETGSGTFDTHVDVMEAARVADIPERAIRRMVSDGEVRHVRIGRVIRIPAREVSRIKALADDQRQGVSVSEAAHKLNVSELTVIRAMDRGEIPARKKVFGNSGGRYIAREVFDRLCRGEAS